MPVGLTPYAEIKDSGVDWLGEVPEQWKVLPNRAIFSEVNDRGHAQEQMLAVTISKGVIPQQVLLKDSSKKDSSRLDRSGYKLVQPEDIAYNKMRAWQGALGVSDYRGIISPAYVVQRPRTNAFARYLHYLFRTPAFAKEAERWSYGITSDMWSLRPEHFKMIYSCIPPLPEQTAIARFLDLMDRRIQKYIRAKEKLIELLEEQKQAIIHEAVTGRIDVRTGKPYSEYKDSGAEWLGKVPEHWEVVRLKHVARVQTGLTLGKNYGTSQVVSRPYLRVANVQEGCLDLNHVKSVNIPRSEVNRVTLMAGDVLMTEGGDIDKLGRGCVWRGEVPGCLHQNHVFAVRCSQGCLRPEFLVGLMGSKHGRAYFEITGKQTTNLASTNSTTLRAFPVPMPDWDEQKAILDAVRVESRVLDRSIKRENRKIELLNEYRTRLIADVVTGKLDVRGAAATLPEFDPVEEDDDCANRIKAGSILTEHDIVKEAIP